MMRPTRDEVIAHARAYPINRRGRDDTGLCGAWLAVARDVFGNPCATVLELEAGDEGVTWTESSPVGGCDGGLDFDGLEAKLRLTDWRYYPLDRDGNVVPR